MVLLDTSLLAIYAWLPGHVNLLQDTLVRTELQEEEIKRNRFVPAYAGKDAAQVFQHFSDDRCAHVLVLLHEPLRALSDRFVRKGLLHEGLEFLRCSKKCFVTHA